MVLPSFPVISEGTCGISPHAGPFLTLPASLAGQAGQGSFLNCISWTFCVSFEWSPPPS